MVQVAGLAVAAQSTLAGLAWLLEIDACCTATGRASGIGRPGAPMPRGRCANWRSHTSTAIRWKRLTAAATCSKSAVRSWPSRLTASHELPARQGWGNGRTNVSGNPSQGRRPARTPPTPRLMTAFGVIKPRYHAFSLPWARKPMPMLAPSITAMTSAASQRTLTLGSFLSTGTERSGRRLPHRSCAALHDFRLRSAVFAKFIDRQPNPLQLGKPAASGQSRDVPFRYQIVMCREVADEKRDTPFSGGAAPMRNASNHSIAAAHAYASQYGILPRIGGRRSANMKLHTPGSC